MEPLSTRIRGHLRSNIYGLIAVFIALGGTAVALPGRNTVDSGDIRNAQVKSVDVAQNTLTGGDIKEATLSGFAVAGHTHDSIYAPLGHNHDSAYAALAHDHDAAYVNEGQADGVTQEMVADTERSVSFQLGSFHRCDTVATAPGYLDFVSGGADTAPDFSLIDAEGGPVAVVWDDTGGSSDVGSDICTQFVVPSDYASGGQFRLLVDLETLTVFSGFESIICEVADQNQTDEVFPGGGRQTYTCEPNATYAPGQTVSLSLRTGSSGGYDDPLRLFSVRWVYNSTG